MKVLILLVFAASINTASAQIFDSIPIKAKIDPKTKALLLNDSVYTGSRDSLVALYRVNVLKQGTDTSEVDLIAVQWTSKRRHRGLKDKKVFVTTFRKQTEHTLYPFQWLAVLTQQRELWPKEELVTASMELRAPERF